MCYLPGAWRLVHELLVNIISVQHLSTLNNDY